MASTIGYDYVNARPWVREYDGVGGGGGGDLIVASLGSLDVLACSRRDESMWSSASRLLVGDRDAGGTRRSNPVPPRRDEKQRLLLFYALFVWSHR